MKAPRINSKGLNTSCVMGFCNTLNEILTKEKPTHIAVASTMARPSVMRLSLHIKLNEKRHRKTSNSLCLSSKISWKAYHIPILQVDGFEADDIIGTVALKAGEKGMETYMLTPDKDYAQLVRNKLFSCSVLVMAVDTKSWAYRKLKRNTASLPHSRLSTYLL